MCFTATALPAACTRTGEHALWTCIARTIVEASVRSAGPTVPLALSAVEVRYTDALIALLNSVDISAVAIVLTWGESGADSPGNAAIGADVCAVDTGRRLKRRRWL